MMVKNSNNQFAYYEKHKVLYQGQNELLKRGYVRDSSENDQLIFNSNSGNVDVLWSGSILGGTREGQH